MPASGCASSAPEPPARSRIVSRTRADAPAVSTVSPDPPASDVAVTWPPSPACPSSALGRRSWLHAKPSHRTHTYPSRRSASWLIAAHDSWSALHFATSMPAARRSSRCHPRWPVARAFQIDASPTAVPCRRTLRRQVPLSAPRPAADGCERRRSPKTSAPGMHTVASPISARHSSACTSFGCHKDSGRCALLSCRRAGLELPP